MEAEDDLTSGVGKMEIVKTIFTTSDFSFSFFVCHEDFDRKPKPNTVQCSVFLSRDQKETEIDRFFRPILEKAGSEIRNARRVGGKDGRERGYCGARWHIVEDA